MFFGILLVLLLTLHRPNSSGAESLHHPKCCDGDSLLTKTNTTYVCTKNENLRLQIATSNTNFLEKIQRSQEEDPSSPPATCIDIEGDSVFVFRIENTTTLTKDEDEEVVPSYFPKCCPLNYYYNATTHSCRRGSQEFFADDNFVKVGLPYCRLIVDLKLDSEEALKRSSDNLELRNRLHYDGNYCVDKTRNGSLVVRICEDSYDVCNSIKCIHKCCPDGQSFINGSFCYNTHVHGVELGFSKSIDNPDDEFAIVHGFNKPLYPLVQHFQYHLYKDGIFSMFEKREEFNGTYYYGVEQGAYCIEHAIKKTTNGFLIFRGFPSAPILTKFKFTRYAMAVSCVFLTLTILYYCLSREKRTLFGKTLISYCVASLLAFALLSFLAFDIQVNNKTCSILGFILFYSTHASFTWLNIMCIDIYWTFGSPKSFSSLQHRSKELKRFMLYSLYGWGLPMVLTALPLIFYHVDVLPTSLQVVLDGHKCYIQRGKGNYALLLFSTTPLAIQLTCNLFLFIKTITYCMRVKGEISKMNDTHTLKKEQEHKFNKYKDRMALIIKLFLIMGVTFVFEIVSQFIDFKRSHTTATIEIIGDTFNSLQGVFIFVIFICKRRIFDKFKKKLGLNKLRRFSLTSSAATQVTAILPHQNGGSSSSTKK